MPAAFPSALSCCTAISPQQPGSERSSDYTRLQSPAICSTSLQASFFFLERAIILMRRYGGLVGDTTGTTQCRQGRCVCVFLLENCHAASTKAALCPKGHQTDQCRGCRALSGPMVRGEETVKVDAFSHTVRSLLQQKDTFVLTHTRTQY